MLCPVCFNEDSKLFYEIPNYLFHSITLPITSKRLKHLFEIIILKIHEVSNGNKTK